MASRNGDILEVIEAAYRVELPQADWLEGLTAAALPLLDDGFGVFGCLYERLAGGGVTPHSLVLAGDDVPASLPLHRALAEAASPEFLARFHTGPAYAAASRQCGAAWHRLCVERVTRLGVRDVLGIVASDPTGLGVAISSPRRRVIPVSKDMAARWERVAAHMAAAYRLRRRLVPRRKTMPEPDAILSPTGALEHAIEAAKGRDARAALRGAAVSLDRARGAMRRKDPDGALEIWKGLVDGQWSLVDHFDSDGRRFLLARRNDPAVPFRAGLTQRERQILGYRALGHSLKLIAYELGLSSATISADLKRGMKKLGLHSQGEIARLFTPGERA